MAKEIIVDTLKATTKVATDGVDTKDIKVDGTSIKTLLTGLPTYCSTNQLSNISLELDSTNNKIKLYGADKTTAITEIDTSSFIVDGMIESVTLTNKKLKFVFNTDAGSKEIEVSLASIGVSVDDAISATSSNPVQNKIIKAELDVKRSMFDTSIYTTFSPWVTTPSLPDETDNSYRIDWTDLGWVVMRKTDAEGEYNAASDPSGTQNSLSVKWETVDGIIGNVSAIRNAIASPTDGLAKLSDINAANVLAAIQAMDDIQKAAVKTALGL